MLLKPSGGEMLSLCRDLQSSNSQVNLPVSEQVLDAGDGGGGISSLSEVSLLSPHLRVLAADPITSEVVLFFSPPLLALLLPPPL